MTEERPRVICHMTTSVDGRIVATGWPSVKAVQAHYDAIHEQYAADAWMCGRITMEEFAGGVRSDAEVADTSGTNCSRPDYRAPGQFNSFAFALDPHGRLAWRSNIVGGDHVVAILSERVSDAYLEALRNLAVYYVFGGKDDIDLRLSLVKVRSQFRVKTLMLEGGGRINGLLLKQGLIDELSLLLAPVADGRVGTPALFDVDGKAIEPLGLSLQSVHRLSDGMVWLRYTIGG